MPKILPYPLDALRKCLELADAISDVGGVCEKNECAEKMGKSLSGAFQTLIGSTVKYGLIKNTKHTLSTTALYRDIMLATDNAEKEIKKRKAFLNIPVFRQLLKEYYNRVIPIENLTPILTNNYNVDEKRAETVARVFIEGAIYLGLIGADFQVAIDPVEINGIALEHANNEQRENDDSESNYPNDQQKQSDVTSQESDAATESITQQYKESIGEVQENQVREKLQNGLKDLYTVNISGPGIETTLEVEGEEDLIILNAITQKLKARILNKVLES
ncbi:MAG: hypothetical protein O3A01_06195 [bacterium]|nr:hypothetical protein [bacterium]